MSQHNIDDDLLALLDDENNGSEHQARRSASNGASLGGAGAAAASGNGASSRGLSGSGSGSVDPGDGARAMEVDEEDEDEEDDAAYRRSKKRSSSSLHKRTGGSSSSKQKRRRLAAVVDEEDEDDDDDAGGVSYPLEGMYRDDDDRERLMQMTELQREAELERRREEIKRHTDAQVLKRLLEKQQGTASSGGSTQRRSSVPKKPSRAHLRYELDSGDDDDAEGSDDDMQEQDEDDEGDYPRSTSRRGMSSSITTAAKSRKRSAVGSSSTKSGALKELKQRREARRKGVREDLDDEELQTTTKVVSSDEESSESDAYEDSDAGRSQSRSRASARGVGRRGVDSRDKGDKFSKRDGRKKGPWSGSKEPPSQRDLQLCQMTRHTIEEMMYKPEWLQHLCGNYIRFQWEPESDGKGQKVAPVRIHEILEARADSSSYYEISPNKPCNLTVKVEMGAKPAWVRAGAISNKPFSSSEYDRWVLRLRGNEMRFPSRAELDEQQLKMDQFHQRKLVDEEVKQMVESKQEARSSFRQKQAALKKANEEAASENGSQSVAKTAGAGGPPGPPPPRPPGLEGSRSIPSKLAGAGGPTLAGGNRDYDQATMAAMNERNRRADRERIKETERRQAAAKRAAMGLGPRAALAGAPPSAGASLPGTPVTAGAGGGAFKNALANGAGTASRLGTPGVVPGLSDGGGKSSSEASGVIKGQQGSSNVVLSLDIDLGDF